VHCVSPLINTIVRIDCESFESVFKDKVKVYSLDKKDIRKLETYLKKLMPLKNGLEADVRAQFILCKSDGSSKVLCYDGGYIVSLNGRGGKVGKNFASFLNSAICK
jgi:hypothetical protein